MPGVKSNLTLEKAIIDYFCKVTGTLIAELQNKDILTKEKAVELIKLISTGVDEISQSYENQNSQLDSVTQS